MDDPAPCDPVSTKLSPPTWCDPYLPVVSMCAIYQTKGTAQVWLYEVYLNCCRDRVRKRAASVPRSVTRLDFDEDLRGAALSDLYWWCDVVLMNDKMECVPIHRNKWKRLFDCTYQQCLAHAFLSNIFYKMDLHSVGAKMSLDSSKACCAASRLPTKNATFSVYLITKIEINL